MTVSLRNDAVDESLRIYNDNVDAETGQEFDDWGYTDTARSAFIAGAAWAEKEMTKKMLKIIQEEQR